ncbi:ROK family protein [Deinococcus peraridilitoris]|uniref:Transcriptional regulator/sugar kinase n=1 Tax=Deinococcus peraridilitoris (strain DSM 19664 / LMG 22246 / CIP 109416 / KR-200) TaxID=937777 RepID=K9ZZ54_DEIPD|nr:ROK family protein [Deinococcus peraridilitoris]AFZ66876.1 transcriptional regulator/sugar kinase [Deinococcus peraridilitoris DSM 19664]
MTHPIHPITTLGVDVGGTKIAYGVLRGETLLTKRSVPTPREGWHSVLDAIARVVEELRAEFPDEAAVGIGVPGPLNHDNTEVKFAPNIYGFQNVPLVAYLSEKLGQKVVLENDAKAAALAEDTLGAAREASSSVYITISTGIGSGIVLNGKVWRGFNGVAGEIGHIVALPGGPVAGSNVAGALEAVASGTAMARDATFAFGTPMTTAEVFDLAQLGDTKAEKIVQGALRYIGMAIADVQKFLDPEMFVLGGGVSEVGPYLLESVQRYADEYVSGFAQVQIRKALLGTDAGVIGAALAARS